MNPQYLFPPRSILVPTDMGSVSKSALKYARFFHERFESAVTVLHAEPLELPPYFLGGQVEDLKRELKKLIRGATEYVQKESRAILGFLPDVRVVESMPLDAILDHSRNSRFDLIVMGMHSRSSAERFWMGSVTEHVLRQSNTPVLAVRNDPSEAPIQKILCPMSTSETGRQALEYAAQISKQMDARLIVLHAVEQGEEPLTCPLVDEQIQKTCRVEEVRFHGNAARTIADAANDLKPDLIVMGAERKKFKLGEMFSSTTTGVMQIALGPLLVVPNNVS
jgi:nucleotide-binding universal stress UspA family protein